MILYSRWLSVPFETRVRIAAHFGVPKSGPTEVVSNVVRSDGFPLAALEAALTADAMRSFLGSSLLEDDLLFEAVVARFTPLDSEQSPSGPPTDLPADAPEEKPEKVEVVRVPSKKAAPKKAAKKAPAKNNAGKKV